MIFESVESVYLNDRLYFWKEYKSYYPENFDDLINKAVEMLKINHEIPNVVVDEAGGVIIAESWTSTKAYMFLREEEPIEIVDNVDISSKFVSNFDVSDKVSWLLSEVKRAEEYFGRFDEVVFVYEWDLSVEDLKRKGIRIKNIFEFISDFLFTKSKLNDEDAIKNRGKWTEFIEEKFG